MNKIVVGLGFGDEGKGLTTAYLAQNSSPNSIVVRHNGGQQAGHTLWYDDTLNHVHSQLGCGTHLGLPTYFTDDCTFYPSSFVIELDQYRDFGPYGDIKPKVYLHPLTMITTPFDIIKNKRLEDSRASGKSIGRHGSVGLGFGQTIERNLYCYKLHARDLFNPIVFATKMKLIQKDYYSYGDMLNPDIERDLIFFQEAVKKIREDNLVQIKNFDFVDLHFEDVIFETAQGVLLDMDYGFFPHVTRSNTTSKNAFKHIINMHKTEIYYVTRSYSTRHGAGPFPQENKNLSSELKNTEYETNEVDPYQGEFKVGFLDTSLLKYAISCDMDHHTCKKNLMITCNDQLQLDDYPGLIKDLENHMGEDFGIVLGSYGPTVSHVKYIL